MDTVVDLNVNRRNRPKHCRMSVVLVKMSRPDLDLSYSQLSKFVCYPGTVHLDSWKLQIASRHGGVTLTSSEAEFVAASQAGQGVVYLGAFGYPHRSPTEI